MKKNIWTHVSHSVNSVKMTVLHFWISHTNNNYNLIAFFVMPEEHASICIIFQLRIVVTITLIHQWIKSVGRFATCYPQRNNILLA